MSDQPTTPVTPTRIIPAGQPLPTLPDGPPAAGALAPWRTPPATPEPQLKPASGPDAAPAVSSPPEPPPAAVGPPILVVQNYYGAELVPAEPPRPGLWERMWIWIGEWHAVLAVFVAVIPIPPYGYSIATAWAAALADARTEAGLAAAYILATFAIAMALLLYKRTRRWWSRPLLVAAIIGLDGVFRIWDAVQLLTGVSK